MKKSKHDSFYLNPPTPIIRGIPTVQNSINLPIKKNKTIAPSFYPRSEQKSRKFSA